MDSRSNDITRLLRRWSAGDSAAFDQLIPLVYEDLRGIAHKHLQSERTDHTLTTTAVVHEAYLHLVEQQGATWQDRAHFFALASKVMRHILVDYARRRCAGKRSGSLTRLTFQEGMVPVEQRAEELLALDEALTRLSERDARLGQVVECRFFGGMTVDDTAEALGSSRRTVERDWTRAKAYLHQALSGNGSVEMF